MIPHARAILFILGLTAGAGLFAAFVAFVLLVLAQNSLAGQNLRHRAAAMKLWRSK